MKKIYILFMFCFILTACAEPDLTANNSEIEEDIIESALGRYVENITYQIEGEKREKVYYVDILVKVKDSFDDVVTKEKLSEMGYLYDDYLISDYNYFNCGSPDCSVGKLIFKTTNNEYSVYYDEKASSHSWPLILEENGEIAFTWEELREENSRIHEKEEAEKLAIYVFMKATYDNITNYGENYAPEIHDPLVSRLAAKKFGITHEQAEQIYIDKEFEK